MRRDRRLPARLVALALLVCGLPFELACGFTITSVSPGVASVGQLVTIQGSGFGSVQGTSTVLFGGTAAGMAVTWSDTSITIAVPAGGRTGGVAVRVGTLSTNTLPFIVSDSPKASLRLPTQLPYPPEVIEGLRAAAAGDFADVNNPSLSGANASQGSVATGDLDEDGHADLVVGVSTWVCRFRGNGNGRVANGECVSVTTPGNDLLGVGLGDFNEDGHPDIAFAAGYATNVPIEVQLGTGTGEFGAAAIVGSVSYAHQLVVDDWNGDGHADLATLGTNALTVLSGSGTGGFVAKSYGVGTQPIGIGSGDLNGDQRPDLIVSNAGYLGGYRGTCRFC